MSFIEFSRISKAFGGVRSLHDVSFSIGAGEVVALAGENGCGKSTLIKVLAGVHVPSGGTLLVDGREYAAIKPSESVAAGIQIIYQDFALFPNLTVAENIAISRRQQQRGIFVASQEERRLAGVALQRLDVSIDLDSPVESIPVASKQLVAIARALQQKARLIVMDEPTTALTGREVVRLLDIVRRLKSEGVSVVFVSHKLAELFSVCDRVVVLRNGEKVVEGPVADFTERSLAAHMTGRDVAEARHALPETKLGDEVLAVEGLMVDRYCNDVHLSIRKGEVVGLAGLLGSGRTELAETLFGLRRPTAGKICIEGQTATIQSPQAAIKAGISYVPEDRLTEGLFLGQSVRANAEAGLVNHYTSSIGWIDRSRLLQVIDRWLDELKVKGRPEAPILSLSGGNQQRVVLTRWLAHNPKVLILNGPSVGVDIGSKADIHSIIASCSESGVGTLLISDDIPELLSCCNRVLIMRSGKISATFSGNELRESDLLAAIQE